MATSVLVARQPRLFLVPDLAQYAVRSQIDPTVLQERWSVEQRREGAKWEQLQRLADDQTVWPNTKNHLTKRMVVVWS